MKLHVGDSGHVEYTGRAFNQDAQEAMAGDIVRALIELITNCDDAYAAISGSETGKILISIDRRHGQDWTVCVRDRATGMTAQELVTKITKLGGRTSGFEHGEDRRGNLGRGAKDVAAFGNVMFESIKNDRYSRLVLRQDGSFTLEADERAAFQTRNTIGVPRGNGTAVTVHVRAGIRCPRRETLKAKLSAHYQLRDVLADPKRKVELYTANSGVTDALVYVYPSAELVFDDYLSVDGYPEAHAHLRLWRLPDRSDEGPESPTRPSGILIKSVRAIYDNTLFGFENRPAAGWFAGRLECPFVDQAAREYDNAIESGRQPDASNPCPIISRRRDGLMGNHPFVKALRAAVEGPLGRLVGEEEERARKADSNVEDQRARAALDRLARELAQLIGDELREIEAEDLPGPSGGLTPALSLVPENAYAYLGEDRTLSVLAREDAAQDGSEVQISCDPEGVVEVLTLTVPLSPHSRRPELLAGQVRLRPLDEASTIVTAVIGDHRADAIIEVRGQRVVEEIEVVPPEAFEFERPAYRIGLSREKSLVIRAPAQLVAELGTTVTVSSDQPGVVVRTTSATLAFDEELEFFKTAVRVEGRRLAATAQVTARLSDISASAHVTVTQKEEGPRYRVRLVDEDMSPYRAVSDTEKDPKTGEDVRVLKVWTRHPALRPILAADGIHSRPARLVIAEAVADVSARLLVSALYAKLRGLEEFTSDRIYIEHYRRVSRLLPRVQQILLADLAQPTGVLETPVED